MLFAHGSREPRWAGPFERLAALLSRRHRGPVRLAYLEFMRPTLSEALAALVAQDVTTIQIIPVFLGSGGHVTEDLPALVDAFQKKNPACRVEVQAPIGEQEAVLEALADAIAASE